jgi:hypothetical protein
MMKEGMRIVIEKDFSNDPIELYDGFEADEFWLDLSKYGISGGDRVNLITEIDKKYKGSESATYKRYYNAIDCRVMAYDKSANVHVSLLGYLALLNFLNGELRIALFSYFEVSPLRYNCYLHRIYKSAA